MIPTRGRFSIVRGSDSIRTFSLRMKNMMIDKPKYIMYPTSNYQSFLFFGYKEDSTHTHMALTS